ncbi:MAG: hypothetical protein ACRYGR_04195 [Janthinobacterium lividum]
MTKKIESLDITRVFSIEKLNTRDTEIVESLRLLDFNAYQKNKVKESVQNFSYYLHPVDLISEIVFKTLINSIIKHRYNDLKKETLSFDKNISLNWSNPGTEVTLIEKLKKESADIPFAYLETGSDLRKNLHDLVFEHTSENDPYTKWVQTFEEIKAASGKIFLTDALMDKKNLPDFLIQIYNDVLYSKRENL